ncbi:MAG TPA: sugar ABC transporter permease [Treponema sp.]|nr:MAG: ABC transporter permease [Treponema sp. GWC1_61_84]HCM25721.1 sugar ABC transporter permease [Treponema sp.]
MTSVFCDRKAIAVFVLPALILFLVVGFLPIAQSAYFSLLEWDGIGTAKFVGLSNYVDVFITDFFGIKFDHSIVNSVVLAILCVFLQLPAALALALVLASGIKGERAYRTIFFIPVVISSASIGVMFLKIYNPDFGVLNELLESAGLGVWKNDWFANERTALMSALLPVVWQYIGYHMLLMYAAIKGIPGELFEAATMDGASPIRTAFSITLPLIRPILRVCVTFAVIGSLKFFDLLFVMTGGSPSPATDVPSTLMYNTIFTRRLYGHGSTMAVFLVAECMVFYLVLQRTLKTREERGEERR